MNLIILLFSPSPLLAPLPPSPQPFPNACPLFPPSATVPPPLFSHSPHPPPAESELDKSDKLYFSSLPIIFAKQVRLMLSTTCRDTRAGWIAHSASLHRPMLS